jgi:hypothetical protein
MTSLFQEYWHDANHPLGAHLGLTVTYTVAMGTLAIRGAHLRLLPETPRLSDVLLVAATTFKLSRLIATERVTTPIRAPFVETERERPTGKGLRRALGELMTCPYCLGPWCALAVGAGLVFAPRPTRFVSSLLTAMAISDGLQRLYTRLARGRGAPNAGTPTSP